MKWPALTVFFSLFLTLPADSQTPTLEQRLEKLEAEVRQLRVENETLRRELGLTSPNIAAAPTPVPSPSPAPDKRTIPAPKLAGFVQMQGESGDRIDSRYSDDNSRFFVRRARLNASGTLLDDFEYKLELDLAGSLSNSSGMRAQMTDGYAAWTRYDGARIRAGQFKTPFGFEQLYSDTRMFTPERALVTDRISPGRQIGAQIFGDVLPDRLTYAIGAFNGTGTNQTFNDNDRFLTAVRLSGVISEWADGGRWSAGVNAFRTNDSSLSLSGDFGFDSTPQTPPRDNLFSGDRRAFGMDSQLRVGRLDLWAEYLTMTFEPEQNLITEEFDARGWYAMAGYFVLPDRLQVVGRFETFDPNTSLSDADTDIWGAGMNYHFNSKVKLQLHYLVSDPPGAEDSNGRLVARIQTEF